MALRLEAIRWEYDRRSINYSDYTRTKVLQTSGSCHRPQHSQTINANEQCQDDEIFVKILFRFMLIDYVTLMYKAKTVIQSALSRAPEHTSRILRAAYKLSMHHTPAHRKRQHITQHAATGR